MPKLKRVGFWNTINNTYPDLPMPISNKANYDIEKMLNYLSNGVLVYSYRGVSRCRICGEINGSSEMVDGVYLWPSGLSHYVEEHQIELPSDFINHVESNQYDISKTIDSVEDDEIRLLLQSMNNDKLSSKVKTILGRKIVEE
jgi:hypothetical protein